MPTYYVIPCALGNNLHAECLTRRKGDLIEMHGHAEMLLTPEDATRLAVTINRIATEIRRDLSWTPPEMEIGAEGARPWTGQ